jgi:pre-mRNA-processing factor 17
VSVSKPKVVVASDEAKSLAADNKLATVFEPTKTRPADKRKKEKNWDSADLDNYAGPWAKYENESRSAKPSEEQAAAIEEYQAKRRRRGRHFEDKPVEEKSTLHSKFSKISYTTYLRITMSLN